MSLMDFYRLTYIEYHYVAKAYQSSAEEQWNIMRTHASLLINLQLPKNEHCLPEDIVRLPSDKVIKVKKDNIPTRADFDEAVRRHNEGIKKV